MSIKIKILVLFVGLTVLLGFSSLYAIKSHPRYYNKLKYYVKKIIRYDRPQTYNSFSYHSKIRNDRYALHRKVAKAGNVPLIKDNSSIAQLLKTGDLVKVKRDKGYRINKLTYSKAVLSKKSYQILKEIGSEFDKKTDRNQYFTVTSLTRTVASQRRLAKRNRNATKSTSTHSYGASFDISYTRFNGKKGRNSSLQKVLEEILMSYQKEKNIYVIKERNSTCYHITAR